MPVRGKTAGNKGQGSKWISRERRLRIYERDGYMCVWCRKSVHPTVTIDGSKATLDHIIPRCEGGTNESTNLITACMKCNRLRGCTYWHDFARERARSFGGVTVVTLFGRIEMPPLKGHLLRMVANEIRKRIRWRMAYGHV